MKVFHIMASGDIGGIEILMKNYALYSKHENIFCFLNGKDQPITKSIKNGGHTVLELGVTKNILWKINKIINFCKDEHIDVAISHHGTPLCHLILLAINKTIPSVTTIIYTHSNIHDWKLSGTLKNKIKKLIFSRSFFDVDNVIAISNSVKASITDIFGISDEKVSVIYNGVDVKKFSSSKFRNSDNSSNAKILELIYVGRLIEEKGVQNILYALSGMPSDLPWHLRIVGDGLYRQTLEKLALSNGISEFVEFLGTRQDISELLSEADVFVHFPKWEEGFGITVIEALAAGKICVCGNRGALPEIINDGKDGFLVENEEQFRSVLEKISKMNDDQRKNICQNAVIKARQFDIRRFAKKLDNYIVCAQQNGYERKLRGKIV